MSDEKLDEVGSDARKILKPLDPAQAGAALSRLVAASIGDLAVVLSRSPGHKHYSFADIEWMVLPAVAAGQFYVVEAAHKETGFRSPIAALTWAFVSEEVDSRLRDRAGGKVRLRPDEWKSGEIAWLVDALGSSRGIEAALRWLAEGPFKEKDLSLVGRGQDGMPTVTTLERLLADRPTQGAVA